MKIRIMNARILTMEDPIEVFEGELHVTDNKISYVGDAMDEGALAGVTRCISCTFISYLIEQLMQMAI